MDMSYGTFHTFVKPNMRYGISFGGTFKGMQMDIDRLMRAGVAKDNTLATLANFNASQGARQSANEHLVPEQLFDDPKTTEKEVEGVSAVKALQLAAQQGQTIYTITKDNYSQVLPKLSLSANVMSDINNAINSGKQVTVHEKSISYKGWNGSGYIILDPTYGTGAYLIDGGANGAFIAGTILTGVGIVTLFAGALGVTIAPILTLILLVLAVFMAIYTAILTATEVLDKTGCIALADLALWTAGGVGLASAFLPKFLNLEGANKTLISIISSLYTTKPFIAVASGGVKC